MTDLVACLTEKGAWGHVSRLIADKEWSKIFIITNDFGKKNFKPEKNVDFVVVDFKKPVVELIEDIKNNIKDKLTGTEVALNFVGGSGKEHMAIISAVMRNGVGFRLVALTKEGVKEI